MFSRLRFPATLFFAASFLGMLALIGATGGAGWRFAAGALVYGLLLGFAVQMVFREPVPRARAAAGAFGGAFTLWLPVVLVTYGFALVAVPVFVAHAIAVAIGVSAASLLRRRRSSRRSA